MDFPNPIPFADHLGIKLLRFDRGESELALTLAPEMLNSAANAHGGVVMTLLDVAMANAARSLFETPGGGKPDMVTTIEMKTSFMRPGLGRLVARGKVLTQTLTMSFCEASIHGEDGKLAAHATGTFKRLRPRVANPQPRSAAS